MKTILIVDDEHTIRSLFTELLPRAAYAVIEAPDGETALELCRKERFEAVLLDYSLPGINGIETFQEMKRLIPDVPVVIMTGRGDIQLAVRFMKLGAYDFVTKPIDLELILEIIKRAMDYRELKSELEGLHVSARTEREINERLERVVKERTADALHAAHLASLGELAAGVAHEINNPINGIINYAQVLADRHRGPEDRDIAVKIIKEGERVAAIVRNLLSFARDSREENRPVHIGDILEDSLMLTGAQLKKDGILLERDIPQGLPAIKVHTQQIRQVFLNIISNARHALNHKYPSAHKNKILEIRGETAVCGDIHYVRTIFHDHGTGIPAGMIGKVTEPFFSTKPAGMGTGLGLSISSDIIEKNGGSLQIESREGDFTRVIIDLPALRK